MSSIKLSPSEVVAVKAPRCNCYGSGCKPVADGQHKAHCAKATKTQRFIASLQQFEVAISALYGTPYGEVMLYGVANQAAAGLEKVRDKAVADWNDDLPEGEYSVVRCIKADGEYLDKCDQYFVAGTSTLCDRCQGREEREAERTHAERGI